jgi:hypothetical protein
MRHCESFITVYGRITVGVLRHVVGVVVTVGSRPKRVEPTGQLAEHCVWCRYT